MTDNGYWNYKYLHAWGSLFLFCFLIRYKTFWLLFFTWKPFVINMCASLIYCKNYAFCLSILLLFIISATG